MISFADAADKVAVTVALPPVSVIVAADRDKSTVGAASSSVIVTVTDVTDPLVTLVKLPSVLITVSSSSSVVSVAEIKVTVPVMPLAYTVLLRAEAV